MKALFKKQYGYYSKYTHTYYANDPYVYASVRRTHYRHFKTKQEATENDFIRFDEDSKRLKLRIRGNRSESFLNPWNRWNERYPCRDGRKTWKEFTKYKKQWMHNIR